MKSFVEYCKDYITFKLPEYEGTETYAGDITSIITEEDNNNGGFESEEVSKQYLLNWWEDCAKFYEYYDFEFGHEEAASLNVFANPRVFMFSMVYAGIDILLSKISIIDDNWNDEIELTEDVIETILNEINVQTRIEW